jgi:ATP-dependent helicase HrpA
VILRMKSLHLGDVEEFPFLEAPQRRAIADGYQLLNELGAVDDANELTTIGRELARLPLDPRVGRMILEARERGALAEVLVIAAALSVQDVRDRPLELQAQADQQHAKFDDEKSEFSGYLRLWEWIHAARGGEGSQHKLSNRQYESAAAPELHQRAAGARMARHPQPAAHGGGRAQVALNPSRPATSAAQVDAGRPAGQHRLEAGGRRRQSGHRCAADGGEAYLGARGIKFYRHPGAHLKKRPGRWIVCAELVETTRLFGRGIANIEPQWIEEVAGHLLKKQLLDPHWEKKAAEVWRWSAPRSTAW